MTAIQERQADHLNRVENQRGHLDAARQAFEVFVSRQDERAVNATLTVSGGVVKVQYLGHVLAALPRTVVADGDLALEYTFFNQPDGTPVWQFYLVEDGEHKFALRSAPGLGFGERICDHTNKEAANHILRGVCAALLASPLVLARPI